MGILLTYRKTGSSKNFVKKVSEELPPDIRATYKDGIILSEGTIEIDKMNKTITIIEKTIYKDEGFEDEPDYTKRIYKQKRNGFFELKNIINKKNDQEEVIFKK